MRNGRVIYGYKGELLFCAILDCWDALDNFFLNARYRGIHHLHGPEHRWAHFNFA